jgi:uncharacterized protein involved in exopolysaccharide biosynthesis
MPHELIEVQRYESRPLPTLRDLVAIVFRQRRIILAVFLSVIALVFLSGVWIPKYQAHMKILVLRQRTDAMVTADVNAPPQNTGQITKEDLNSEVELLKSDDLLQKVVVQTGLQHQQRSLFGHEKETTAIAAAVRKLGKDLDVEPVRDANVISVSYRASNPQLAAKALNAVAAAYMEKHLEMHRPSGEFTFFDQQTKRFRVGLEQSQAQLEEFTERTGVASAPLQRDLTLQKLADFNATAHQAQVSAAQTLERIRSIQAQLSTMQPRLTTEIRTAENPQLMQQLKSTLLNLQLKRTELLTKFDPSYRLVKEVDQQILEAQAAIAAAENKPPQDTTTDQNPTYTMLRDELAKAEADLSGLRAQAAAAGLAAGEYRVAARELQRQGIKQEDLQRTEKTDEQNYLLYLQKREEARINDALDQRGILNVALAERPMAPALPVRSPVQTGGIALVLALFVGFGAGFVADYVDPSFRTPDEVVGYLDMPVLASLPKDTQ